MMWIGVLVLFSLDLWVSADELGHPTTFWWDNDTQVKNNNNQESWTTTIKNHGGIFSGSIVIPHTLR